MPLLFILSLFWFVKDFSPGSAVELSQLTENVSILTEKDPVIAGQYGRVMFTCALHFIWFSHFR